MESNPNLVVPMTEAMAHTRNIVLVIAKELEQFAADMERSSFYSTDFVCGMRESASFVKKVGESYGQ